MGPAARRHSRSRGGAALVKAIIAQGLLAFTAGPVAAATPEVLVPAYFYPVGNPFWQDLTTAAAIIGVNAILNPASGPGVASDSNYVTAVTNLRSAGGRVLGYVSTAYGGRPALDVKADIDDYILFYSIDGIFLDEMTTDSAPTHLAYYSDLYSYIKSQSNGYRVIGNPGTNTDELYLTQPTADALVIFENVRDAYTAFTPSSWVMNHTPEHFAHIVHGAAQPDLATLVSLAVQRNAGLLFITDDTLPNPYDTLPSYWNQEVALIAAASAPEPSTSVLGSICGLLVLWQARHRRRREGRASERP